LGSIANVLTPGDCPKGNSDLDENLARQQQIVERLVTVLEKNPRRGTALDRIYDFHIEKGTIEAFVKGLRERVAAKPDDGVLYILDSRPGQPVATRNFNLRVRC